MSTQDAANTNPPIREAPSPLDPSNGQMPLDSPTEAGTTNRKSSNSRAFCHASELVLPGESEQDFKDRCEQWEKDQGAVTEPERYEVFNAVHASWRQDRMRRAETVALADLVDKVAEQFHDQKEQETRELVERLPESPCACVKALRSTTAGLTWLIGQVEILTRYVAVCGEMTQSQRVHLIHLSGKRPTDLFICPVVAQWDVLYLATSPRPDEDRVRSAVLDLAGDRPPAMDVFEFMHRVEQSLGFLPPADEALVLLKQELAAMLAELTDRRELIGLREERDFARAIAKAKADAEPAGARRQSIENSLDRMRRNSLKEVRSLQKSRPEPGEPDGTPSKPGPGPGTGPDEGPTIPQPGTNHAGPGPTEPAARTPTNGSVVTTGTAAAVETATEPVNTATADASAKADTPKKRGAEPTCQNGSGDGEVVAGGESTLTPSEGETRAGR
jgi:hypothetical protein